MKCHDTGADCAGGAGAGCWCGAVCACAVMGIVDKKNARATAADRFMNLQLYWTLLLGRRLQHGRLMAETWSAQQFSTTASSNALGQEGWERSIGRMTFALDVP